MEKKDNQELEIKILKDKIRELEAELAKRPTTEEVKKMIEDVKNWARCNFPAC